mgnify:CR=1 FL=1
MAPIPLPFLQGTLIARSGCVLLHLARDMHEVSRMIISTNLLEIKLFAVAMGLLFSASLTEAALIDNGDFTYDITTGIY